MVEHHHKSCAVVLLWSCPLPHLQTFRLAWFTELFTFRGEATSGRL